MRLTSAAATSLLAFGALIARAQESETVPASVASDTARVNAAVREARAIFAQVGEAFAQKRLVERDTSFTCPEGPGYEDHFRLLSDSGGVIRQLRWRGGTDAMSAQTTFFYDSAGRLRFSFETVVHGDNGGFAYDARRYYEASGALVKRVYEITRKGELTYFSSPSPARDPRNWVRDFCRSP